jgi:hypothetical protein
VTTHSERLTAPPSWWVAAVAFAVTCGWIVLVVGSTVAAVATGVLAGALSLGLVAAYGSTVVSVAGDGLRAGAAHLDAPFLGAAEVLHRADYRARLGVEADVRAHLLTRPYLDRGVLVHVADPADPTPYWLLSSRRPDDLAAAVNAHHSTHEGTARGHQG